MTPRIKRLDHKLTKLRKQHYGQSQNCEIKISKHIIHDFSLYSFFA